MVVGCCELFRFFCLFSGCFKLVSVVSESFWLLTSSRLFSLLQVVEDSVRFLKFLRMSLVVHEVYLDVESFRSS